MRKRCWGAIAIAMFVLSGRLYAEDASMSGDEEASMDEYLEMQANSAPFRALADSFITVAARGDAEATAALISPHLAAQAGAEVVADVVTNQVLPFFAEYGATVPSVTITETSDQFGSSGYAYYMWMEPRTTEAEPPSPKPFVIYVVQEGERIVVGNILVDHYVEGRH